MALKRLAKRVTIPKLFQKSIHPSWMDIKHDRKPKVVILGCGWGGFRVGTFRSATPSVLSGIFRIIYCELHCYMIIAQDLNRDCFKLRHILIIKRITNCTFVDFQCFRGMFLYENHVQFTFRKLSYLTVNT